MESGHCKWEEGEGFTARWGILRPSSSDDCMILEWPHPQIDQDWDSGKHQWREITPLAYRELQQEIPLLHKARNAFMQAEPVDVLADGDGLYVCCKQEKGFYFARLLPGNDWWKRDYLPMPFPEAGTDLWPKFFKGAF